MGLKDQLATFDYLQWQPLYEEEKPYEIFIQMPEHMDHSRRTNLVFAKHTEQLVEDIRGHEDDFDLNTQGFQILHEPTSFNGWWDRNAVEEVYLPECERLLRKYVEGVDRVFFFNWRVSWLTNVSSVD